jgi:ubiquinone/menaquinone biosynthesis C-methylase UbiE
LTESVSFDRAANYYDQTRSLPDELMDVLVSRLLAEIPREGLCLEIGIGTGRIAVPLMGRGVRVVGVDISMEMLHRLQAKRRDAKIALADATRLPFRDATFGSAIASHVLHLVPDWRRALDELVRVVGPGGVLLISRGADPAHEWNLAVRRRFFTEAGDPPWLPGMRRMDEADAEMRLRGAEVRVLEDVWNESTMSIEDLLAAMEQGIWAACWAIDDDTRRKAAAATREWARGQFGDLEAPRPHRQHSDWRAYRLAE